MNLVSLIGRICKDVDVRYTQGEKPMCVAKYTLAVERKFKKEGQQTADFINCVSIGNNGIFAEKYLRKGMKIAVTGHIQTGSYKNKDGNTVYTTDVMVDSHEFCESKGANNNAAPSTNTVPTSADLPDLDSFLNVDGLDTELPFM